MNTTIKGVSWSAFWTLWLSLVAVFAVGVPRMAVLAYALGALATGATVLANEWLLSVGRTGARSQRNLRPRQPANRRRLSERGPGSHVIHEPAHFELDVPDQNRTMSVTTEL